MKARHALGALLGAAAGAGAAVVAHAPLGWLWGHLAGQLGEAVGRATDAGASWLDGDWSRPVALLSSGVAATVVLWVVVPSAARRPPAVASLAVAVALAVLGAPLLGLAMAVSTACAVLPPAVRRTGGAVVAGTSLSLLWLTGGVLWPTGAPDVLPRNVLHLALAGLVVVSAAGAVRLAASPSHPSVTPDAG